MEFKGIDPGDKRRNRRAILLAEQLSGNPTASIPPACGGWAETAAYRSFAQDQLEWIDVVEPHWQSSTERMRACEVVLCLDDTTS
ncbi:transposase DNA-binding-containing protein [Burkholderia sp. Nafp2/4-1b]|uniref:IS4/Tn5 family transposase DNA-binding protein n=1 Tax=Burkholderia sp. Nafp2/4-1b TaxID=2116686 RepID=UPI001F08E911|nr:transposase DNA-binding-containing protein [Burkholderia sp. Nafp2/4-1b]